MMTEIIIGLAILGVVGFCVFSWVYLAMEAAESKWRTPTYYNRRHLPEVMEPPIYYAPNFMACVPEDEDEDDDDDWGDE